MRFVRRQKILLVVSGRIEILNRIIIESFVGKMISEQRLEGEEGVSHLHTPWAEGTAYTKALK